VLKWVGFAYLLLAAFVLDCAPAVAQTPWSSNEGEFALMLPEGWSASEDERGRVYFGSGLEPDRARLACRLDSSRFRTTLTQDEINGGVERFLPNPPDGWTDFEIHSQTTRTVQGRLVKNIITEGNEPRAGGRWHMYIMAFSTVHEGNGVVAFMGCRGPAPLTDEEAGRVLQFLGSLTFPEAD
jgi:hypothetical protein